MRLIRLALILALSLILVPLTTEAQQAAKVYRIGFLRYYACPEALRSEALRDWLAELGYVDGRNLVIECRAAPGKWEQLPDLAAELVHLNVDVLATEGRPARLGGRQA